MNQLITLIRTLWCPAQDIEQPFGSVRALIPTTIAAAALVGIAHPSSAEQCQGTVQNQATPPGYSFVTTSRVYQDGYGFAVYETCVANTGNRDLWIDWYIPGPTSYILPGKALPSARLFPSPDKPTPFAGCFEYGNLSNTRLEHFVGDLSDAENVTQEEAIGCAEAARDRPSSLGKGKQYTTVSGQEIRPVQISVVAFFPSDLATPLRL